MRKRVRSIVVAVAALAMSMAVAMQSAEAKSTHAQAQSKMGHLEQLIKQADAKGINTLKERTALRTAEIFLDYAMWDEKNVAENEKHFARVGRYKTKAAEMAQQLPEFERQEIVKMMDSSIAELNRIMKGELKRLESPNIDWSRVRLKDDAIMYQGKPVFLSDWTWKPTSKKYTEYFGQMDGQLISPHQVNADGTLNANLVKELQTKPSGTAGMVFMAHTQMPAWATKQDPSLKEGGGIKYVMYDLHNELGRDITRKLLAQTVPQMAGKNYAQLGYMLCNEPHWNQYEGEYAESPFSEQGRAEFRKWLERRHGTIANLNSAWRTKHKSFEAIELPKLLKMEQIGTPLHHDMLMFNMDRTTEWFKFLRAEILKHDPAAKTHIKIMPNMWSEDKKDNGLDFEELCRMSEILGNDAKTTAHLGWGKQLWWEDKYSFNWAELASSHDFMKSVSPNKMIYNTEGHLITTNRYRNLYETPEYIRANYWLAHIHGLTAIRSWFWCRKEDGSSRPLPDSPGYAGSNNHQPRVVNEVHATTIDLNSVSDKIMEFQRQRKPVRIFYSKSAAINSATHMSRLFEVYENLYFEGIPLGYVTEGIIENNPHSEWDVVVVARTPRVERSEVVALQKYLDQGGTIIRDKASLQRDEYGRPMDLKLEVKSNTKGRIIEAELLKDIRPAVMPVLRDKKQLPQMTLVEDNGMLGKSVSWRVIQNPANQSYIMSMVNVGKNPAKIKLQYRNWKSQQIKSVTNYLTGEKLSPEFELGVHGTLMLEIK